MIIAPPLCSRRNDVFLKDTAHLVGGNPRASFDSQFATARLKHSSGASLRFKFLTTCLATLINVGGIVFLVVSMLTKVVAGSVLFGLAVSFFMVWRVGPGKIADVFRNASWTLILLYFTVSLLIALFLTLKWHVALDAYGVRLPFYTLFIYRLIGFAVSYVTPTAHVGGEPVRAVLIQQQGIPPKVSFSAVIADKSLELIVNIAMFSLGALFILNTASFPLAARVSIMALSVLAALLAVSFLHRLLTHKPIFTPVLRLLRFHKRPGWKRLERTVHETERLIEHFYRHKRRHFYASLAIMTVLWTLMYFEYRFALQILGYDPSVFHVFLFLTGVGIAYSIPIPAALGVLELGQVTASTLLGIGAAIGAALAIVVRVRDILWTLIGLVLLGMLHLNLFRLYERSRLAAKKYNFRSLDAELRGLYE
jgi:glycosyltransferase 2 family protein